MDERIYKIALSQLQTIGVIKAKILVSCAGNLKSVFTTTDTELAKLAKITVKKVKKFNRKKAIKRAKEEITFIDSYGITLHYYQDTDFPTGLKFCPDGPILFFSKGKINFKKQNIAIVGTRKATNYGIKRTQNIVKELAPRNVQIISGLAYGIDKEAHEAALANNLSTIAVLGHGFDLIYPAAHKNLAKRMLENGGLVTEFLSNSPRDPSNFPKRNRIVAGLSDATIVVESAKSGGSLITAELAFDYNREVFAFPGNTDSPSSDGCNSLIKRDIAHLITCVDDMIEPMKWKEMYAPDEIVQIDLFDSLTVNEEQILKLIKKEKKATHIDLLTATVSMSLGELTFNLFNLEMKGTLISSSGNMYQAC